MVRTKDQIPSSNRPLLLGLLHDEDGLPLTTNHAVKNGRRYGYYISRELSGKGEEGTAGWRLPARRIEDVALTGIEDFINCPARMMDAVQETMPMEERPSPDVWMRMNPRDLGREQMKDLITRIDLARESVTLHIDIRRVANLFVPSTDKRIGPATSTTFSITLPITLKRRGSEMRIVLLGKTKQAASTDRNLVTMIARARSWLEDLKTGQSMSLEDIARNEKMSASDVSRYLPLAFLAPDIVEATLEGSQPADLTLQKIKRLPPLPMSWQDQRVQLGFQS